MKLEFSQQLFEKKKKPSNIKFIKIRPVGAELFHAERQTDMTKLIAVFRNFATARPINVRNDVQSRKLPEMTTGQCTWRE
jgi:hypothetical protein